MTARQDGNGRAREGGTPLESVGGSGVGGRQGGDFQSGRELGEGADATSRVPTGERRRGRRLPVVLTEGELEALLCQVTSTTSTTGLRNRTMLAVMAGAGLRVSEVCDLRGYDADLARGELRVNEGKGGKDRVVPVDGETRGWLAAWGERRKALGLNGRDPLFVGLRTRTAEGYQGLGVSFVQKLVGRLAKAAGIEKAVSPHTLRHTYATRLLDRGFTIREVQMLLGHASIQTTQIYTHVHPEALRAKVQGEEAGVRRQASGVRNGDGNGCNAEAQRTAVESAENGEVGERLGRFLSGLTAEQRKALGKLLEGEGFNAETRRTAAESAEQGGAG